MKCQPLKLSNGNFSSPKCKSFKGIPERISSINVHDWHDAIKYWEMLKQAKYLDAHSYGYKHIRENNYSFLDKLSSYTDKSAFISKFCEFTKFPKLSEISSKIDEVFHSCLSKISYQLNSQTYSRSPYRVVDAGYDPTCSVSLKKAFPGSDLDKGYVILEGNHAYKSDTQVVNEFKGALWDNLDQRIVSLNHPDTTPEVYTEKQVNDKLDELDNITQKITDRSTQSGLIAATGAIVGDILLGPLGVPLGMLMTTRFLGDTEKYEKIKDSNETNPYTAAEFNRELASRIPSSKDRESAKNFAFFIETVESNLNEYNYNKNSSLFDNIRRSPFVRNSNVTQIGAWKRKINNGYLKSKLRNREQLERDFNYMTNEDRYELIKDVVKYSSNDQSTRFSKYFVNDDDIKGRYDSLLGALK